MDLFKPITVRGLTLKNRVVLPPMVVMPFSYDYRSREVGSYFLERARGGAGTLIVGYTHTDLFVSDEAWGEPGSVARFVNESCAFTNTIRQAGARIGIQLSHHNQIAWRIDRVGSESNEWIAPSPKEEEGPPLQVGKLPPRRELTIPEIETIIGKFATAACCQSAIWDTF